MSIAKALCEALEAKYKEEDADRKKCIISRYLNFKITEEKLILAQIHAFQIIANELASNGIKFDELFHVGAIIDKLPPSWKDYPNSLMHKSEDFSLEQLMIHLRIEEETRLQDKKDYKSQMVVRAHIVEGPRKKKPRSERRRKMEEKKEEKKDPKVSNTKTA
ncbi:hypothetical protein AMTR_s00005p00215710 [Amborella trichopoda]|uniref:Uncharacterized protein n=1 Tax=Amborella trichopoda TaxID=13333 RepID=W1PGJ0_AMBTC|nr:hypothetical protein AMTR_s00005p00215710 [Amborella trichopoda]